MPRSVLVKLLEARDEILGITHPDEPLLDRLEHGYKSIIAVVGEFIAATDDENRAADLAQLQADMTTVLRNTADRFLADRPILLGGAQMVITGGAAAANAEIAKHSENWDEWVEANVTPIFRKLRDLADYTATQLEGDAHNNPDHSH